MKIFEAYNHLLESDDISRLYKIFARYEIFKKIIKVPGDIIECGVFKGTGHIYWLKLLKIYDPLSIRKVIGFDTFNYFPNHKRYNYPHIRFYNYESILSLISNQLIKSAI